MDTDDYAGLPEEVFEGMFPLPSDEEHMDMILRRIRRKKGVNHGKS